MQAEDARIKKMKKNNKMLRKKKLRTVRVLS